MRVDAPFGTETQAIHATAVAIGSEALLIRGVSRAGKSRLACSLIARSTGALRIHLVGDDRILLTFEANGLFARPHPRIAGFIERRGLGLVAMPWVLQAKVGGVVELAPRSDLGSMRGAVQDALLATPRLSLECSEDGARADCVLAWWAGLSAAGEPHLFGEQRPPVRMRAKD